jgi:hypothetical protein
MLDKPVERAHIDPPGNTDRSQRETPSFSSGHNRFRVSIGHGFSNYTFDDRPRGRAAIAADPGSTSE